jgi:hypothetical protein
MGCQPNGVGLPLPNLSQDTAIRRSLQQVWEQLRTAIDEAEPNYLPLPEPNYYYTSYS